MKIEVNDIVKLPFEEIGTVVAVDDKVLWGFKYKVKVETPSLNNAGDIIEAKEGQMKLIWKYGSKLNLPDTKMREEVSIEIGSQDFYKLLASKIFGVPYNDIPMSLRMKAKQLNYESIRGINKLG